MNDDMRCDIEQRRAANALTAQALAWKAGRMSAFEQALHIEVLGGELEATKRDYREFLEALTRKLNDAGVPAMPSWSAAIDYLARERDEAREALRVLKEHERLTGFDCPACGARRGDPCNDRRGSAVWSPHKARPTLPAITEARSDPHESA